MKKIIPLMFCFDKNYVIPAAVAFYSLLEHANKDCFYKMYVLHTDINQAQQEKLKDCISEYKDISSLEFINMEHRFQDVWEKVTTKIHFSKEVMYKLLVGSIFPQYDKIIVSDVDVVFLDDISASFNAIDADSDFYVAGIKPLSVIERYGNPYKHRYNKQEQKRMNHICGGYLVFNLKSIRKSNIEQQFIDFLEKNQERLVYLEQDVLNYVCYEKIVYLPLNYVTCTYFWELFELRKISKIDDRNYTVKEIDDAMNNPIQLHYASTDKPWKDINCIKSEEWFKYIVKTSFLNEYLVYLEQHLKQKGIDSTKVSTKFERIKLFIKRNPRFLINPNFYKLFSQKIKSKIK